jgi:hypothetical protein
MVWADHGAVEPIGFDLDRAAALAGYERAQERMVDLAHDGADRALIDALVTWHGMAVEAE